MLVGSKKSRLGAKLETCLFANLSDGGVYQHLAAEHAACGDLSTCLGMVAVVEDEEFIVEFHVDHNSAPKWSCS